jgi:hypothetical protein
VHFLKVLVLPDVLDVREALSLRIDTTAEIWLAFGNPCR